MITTSKTADRMSANVNTRYCMSETIFSSSINHTSIDSYKVLSRNLRALSHSSLGGQETLWPHFYVLHWTLLRVSQHHAWWMCIYFSWDLGQECYTKNYIWCSKKKNVGFGQWYSFLSLNSESHVPKVPFCADPWHQGLKQIYLFKYSICFSWLSIPTESQMGLYCSF